MSCLVAVVGFNRPRHLEITLEALSCALLNKSSNFQIDIHVFVDRALSPNHIEDNVNVINLIKSKSLNYTYRENNYGLRKNIIDILKIFKKSTYDNLILIEDDILIHRDAFRYFEDMFFKYKQDENIIQISCFSPLEDDRLDVFRHPRLSTWCWGTWRNKLPDFDDCIVDWSEFNLSSWLTKNYYKLYCMPDVIDILEAQAAGKINAWSLDLLIYMINNNLQTIYPTSSLSLNIGHDGSGINCGKQSIFNWRLRFGGNNFGKSKLNICEIRERSQMEFIQLFKDYYQPSIIKKLSRLFL
jgi:hypothetical protein